MQYEERIERDLAVLRERVADLATRVDRAVVRAVRALLHLDRDLAARIILGDHAINQLAREIDHLCHVFVARHLPAARFLRYVSSVLRLTIELERVGDYAVAIAREAVQLSKPAPDALARDLEMLAQHSRGVLTQALQAFQEGSAERARGTKSLAAEWAGTFDRVYADILKEAERGTRPSKDIFSLFFAFIRLARINDQGKNICEEAIFAATGEAKERRVCKILFIDERNDLRSVMAEAIARRSFPESGEYASAGWNPATAVAPEVVEFLDSRGYPAQALRPRALRATLADLAEHDVIVSLQADATKHLQEIPFHTVLLRWEVGPPPGTPRPPLTEKLLEEMRQGLSTKIEDLMETLRGEQAD
jgi:phosphate transport system protein